MEEGAPGAEAPRPRRRPPMTTFAERLRRLRRGAGGVRPNRRAVRAGRAPAVNAASDPPRPPQPPRRPSVTYKCRKCGRTTFATVEALKEHQLACVGGAEGSDRADAPRPRARLVLCSACGTYLEPWALYPHMREAHARHICLFCLKLFSRPRRLAFHLKAKHEADERAFDTADALAAVLPQQYHLTCCRCEAGFQAGDDFADHHCPRDETPFGLPEEEAAQIPEARPERITGPALEQLIMEVKNCVAAPPAPVENGPPPDGRVPKLTVKIPKPNSAASSPVSSSSSSSDGEDDALRIDSGAGEDGERAPAPAPDRAPPPDAEPAVAGDDVLPIELTLDRPLDRYEPADLLRTLLAASVYTCIYCNHARRIAVDGRQLGLHFISQHRFTATVDSITAEELLPETIVTKLRSRLDEVRGVHVNLSPARTDPDSEAKPFQRTYECFQCYYSTVAHKDLYFHNRKMHQKNILLCTMCKSNFYTYGELICHLCPGTYIDSEISFECCLCYSRPIPSAFRLMVHLRKRHLACDVCLEICPDQSKLSVHVWKHKLHHLCYRCGIAYRNKPDITKHLFWKHGTESVLCKKCLQKKWPHVYHLCVPPSTFACDECASTFSKAVHLKVHKRLHSGEYVHECKEPECAEKFISKKLLAKHQKIHSDPSARIDDEKSDVDVINLASSPGPAPAIDLTNDKEETAAAAPSKTKRSKKHKTDKDNIMIDVNLPELNLSESGSSDESETESQAKTDATEKGPEVNSADEPRTENPDEGKEEPVAGIWDNFKLYQQSLEKPDDVPHVPKHVCDSDHDYCVIPADDSPDVEIVGETKPKLNNSTKDSPKKKKASKNKSKNDTMSSSSDSSSDSDSSCSRGSNCTCCSSSGSSSSSSSSDSSGSGMRNKKKMRKNSVVSHTSAVEIMNVEESPTHQTPKMEFSIPESDLETEESATDEEFYDEHPERIASKILAEKRNQLVQLASSSPINNGVLTEPEQSVKEETDTVVKKKVKVKKRKKEKKTSISIENNLPSNTDSLSIPTLEKLNLPNKITISLQNNKTQMNSSPPNDYIKSAMAMMSDADSKRASKRRRVPNKFYGYSSDEEFAPPTIKPHLPPKLEWRKEDLPSTGSHYEYAEPLRISDLLSQTADPPMPMKLTPKDSSSEDSDSSREGVLQIVQSPPAQQAETKMNDLSTISAINSDSIPFPRPAGAREAREGESVYCYCRCPYDEVSEMIACDADGCSIEWFHFECVGIMVPPKGKWFCPDCRLRLDNSHK